MAVHLPGTDHDHPTEVVDGNRRGIGVDRRQHSAVKAERRIEDAWHRVRSDERHGDDGGGERQP
jgi:hypothetical protein